MKTEADRIFVIRKKLLNKPRKYFKKYGIAESSLRNWEHGYCSIPEEEIPKLIQAFQEQGIECDKTWIRSGEGINPFNQSLIKLTKKQTELHDIEQIIKANHGSKSFSVNTNELEPFMTYGDIVVGNEKKIDQIENLYVAIHENSIKIGFCKKISPTLVSVRYVNSSNIDILNIKNIYKSYIVFHIRRFTEV